MNKGCVLVVDDDREMRVSLSHLLEKAGFSVHLAKNGQEALDRLVAVSPDVVLSDVRMPGMDGLEVQRRVSDLSSAPVVLFSAHGDIPLAVQAIQNGAYNFVEKPFDPRRLLTLLSNAIRLKRTQDSAAQLEQRLNALTDLEQILIGDSPRLVLARAKVLDFAASPANVMVTGPTGSGKELVARALHDLSKGPSAPFIAVNCAVIPPDHFEASVFGSSEAPGLMQRADGGTLFLDELTSMPMETQSKFLRIIEQRQYQPQAGGPPIAVNLRLVSAMSQTPEDAVSLGRLRQDLLFRLNTLMIDLPPLCEREEDILLIFRHYLKRLSTLYSVKEPQLNAADFSSLMTHDWPGNIRELQSVAERMVLASKRGTASVAEAIGSETEEMPTTLREAVSAFERQLIGQAVAEHQGRMDDAASALGIGRRTLNEKMVKLAIDKSEILPGEG